jgi:hypothetical protein
MRELVVSARAIIMQNWFGKDYIEDIGSGK